MAPAGTVTVICEAESALKLGAEVPLKETAVAPVKPLPLKVTEVPTAPEVGVKPVIQGIRLAVDVGGVSVLPRALKLAAEMPLKATAPAPVKPLPVRVAKAPSGPEAGEKQVTAETSRFWQDQPRSPMEPTAKAPAGKARVSVSRISMRPRSTWVRHPAGLPVRIADCSMWYPPVKSRRRASRD